MKKYPKLPKAFKTKWVKALRSGKFKQGINALKKDYEGQIKYCCLGVACELVGAKINMNNEPGFIEDWKDVKGITKIPKILRGSDFIPDKLACMNDGEGVKKKTFRGIATWIEKHL